MNENGKPLNGQFPGEGRGGAGPAACRPALLPAAVPTLRTRLSRPLCQGPGCPGQHSSAFESEQPSLSVNRMGAPRPVPAAAEEWEETRLLLRCQKCCFRYALPGVRSGALACAGARGGRLSLAPAEAGVAPECDRSSLPALPALSPRWGSRGGTGRPAFRVPVRLLSDKAIRSDRRF